VVCECVTTIVEIQDLLVHSQRRAHAGVLVSCDVCGRVSGVSCVAAVCRRPSVSAVGRVLAAADAMHISVLFQRRPASFAFSELMEFVVRARFRGSRSDVRPDSPLSHIYIIAGVLLGSVHKHNVASSVRSCARLFSASRTVPATEAHEAARRGCVGFGQRSLMWWRELQDEGWTLGWTVEELSRRAARSSSRRVAQLRSCRVASSGPAGGWSSPMAA